MTPRVAPDRRFVAVVGLAALVDRLDRIDLVWAWTEPGRFRVPVRWLGLGFPTPVLPRAIAVGLIAFGLAAAISLVLGARVRIAAAVVATVSLFDLVVDQQGYSNHTVLIGVLGALTAGFHGTDPAALALTVRAQTSSVYLFAALSKLRPDWWSGDILVRAAQSPLGVRMVRDLPMRTLAVVAVFTVITEMILATALWSWSWRPLSITLGLAFHLSIIAVLGWDLGLVAFGLAMVAHLTLPPGFGPVRGDIETGIPHQRVSGR